MKIREGQMVPGIGTEFTEQSTFSVLIRYRLLMFSVPVFSGFYPQISYPYRTEPYRIGCVTCFWGFSVPVPVGTKLIPNENGM
ncbi:hypothetical protein Hanom_Chr11g01005141 [Helianthus anomalus]